VAIRPATDADHDAIWVILEPMIRRGDTYTLPRDMSKEQALEYWFSPEKKHLSGRERHRARHLFLESQSARWRRARRHCGYVTGAAAQGRGIARAMCLHSLERAKQRGFRAMQFNFVVSTNERAVKLWSSLGFEVVGRLQRAFEHPELGFVDALVMYRELD